MWAKALQRNQQQVQSIHDHLLTIRRNMEQMIGENRQLRDELQRVSQQLAECQQEQSLLVQRDQEYELRRLQVGQCVDDALAQVEWALAHLANDEEEDEEGAT
ncbi:MAG: hypothetical protein Q9M13_06105 [Mariprofundales bacterium]|nr:hypothetical protein [Mariprofundales bacterium]